MFNEKIIDGKICMCFIRSEQISKRQSQIDRLYVSLKDLVEERKCRLEQQYWLFQLHREVEELEQWIAEREISASSTELGQDYEHVTVRQQHVVYPNQFSYFSQIISHSSRNELAEDKE